MNDYLMIDLGLNSRTKNKHMHEWATPLTIGAFALSAFTGILLFFKIHLGLIKQAHEWLSWLLVLGTLCHLMVNWRSTVRYFAKPVGRGILLIFFLLICASLLPLGGEERQLHADKKITDALLQAPLSTVLLVAKQTPEKTLEILETQGFNLDNWHQTLKEIAGDSDKRAIDVLILLLRNER